MLITTSRMPWASFLMMTADSPAKKPVGMLINNKNWWWVRWAFLHLLNCSTHWLIFCLNTLISFYGR